MMRSLLRRFAPAPAPVSTQERLRSACGAAIGLLVTGLVARWSLGSGSALPAMIAPMGASAVLLFAIPSSPLAQPRSILGGNIVAALVGVAAASSIADPILASALAAGGAIALMMWLGCLHPPSGAVALTAVLGGPPIRELGYGFVLWPVGLGSALLLVTALVINNLIGRSYPHLQTSIPPAPDGAADAGTAWNAADIDAALKEFDEVIDIGPDDLRAILRRAQIHASLRRSGQTTCAAILSRRIGAIAPETSLGVALDHLRRHRVTMLPITDERARLLGVVTQADLIDKSVWDRHGPRLGLRRRIRLTFDRGRAPRGCVADVMTTVVPLLRPETVAAEASLQMTRAGLHHAPVVGLDGRLVGIVAQTELIAALLADVASCGDEPPHVASSAGRSGVARAPGRLDPNGLVAAAMT